MNTFIRGAITYLNRYQLCELAHTSAFARNMVMDHLRRLVKLIFFHNI